MIILVIGLGSMGRRRLRLLREIRPDITLCGVDQNEERRVAVKEESGIAVYASVTEAIEKAHPEAAIVSSSPLSHASIVRECLQAGLHVFTELNLVADGYEENIALAESKALVLFMSSTFLYRRETQYLIERAREYRKKLNYRYHVGQYLPDWHPWENYTDYFIGDNRTNGCRELFAIELPWLMAAFGRIDEVKVLKTKCTSLRIGYSDSYMVLLKHHNGHIGSLNIDVVSRNAERLFEMYGEDLSITWNGTPDTLQEWDARKKEARPVRLYEDTTHRDGYAGFVIENAYADELCAFLDSVETGKRAAYGFKEDLKTLTVIDEIERAGE